MIAASLTGVPLRVYSVHGLPLETATGLKRRLLRWTERVSCLLAHRVLPVSPSLSRRVVEERLCAPGKLRLLGKGTVNGVDATNRFVPGTDQFQAAREFRQKLGIHPESMVIGFVGRIVRDKGVQELAQAWCLLRPEFPEAHLVLAGTFEPQDPVPADIERILRADPRIHLLGHVGPMPPVFAAMDVVALPTFREGFPQVPLEAAAMERPVVGTRVTGCVDAIVDGVTGTLVDAGDARALAAALRRYLLDPGLRQTHGRAARMRILRDFRPESLCQAMEDQYRSGLGTGSGGKGAPPSAAGGPPGPAKPASRPLAHVVKRVIDICGAATALAIAGPLMGLIALGTWLTLGSPILFRQQRPGLKGRPFFPLKFRTMRDGPEKDAVRMTRLGRLLRHLSLDELPQLWNVLRGEMSLVGPRPLLMSYLKRYTSRLARRHDVKPGLTGWCQVNGRNSLAWDRKFEFDIWYVDNWSLLLDFKILALTVGRVVRTEGIEGPGKRCWPEALGIGSEAPGTGETATEARQP
jgi:lipopolysaccharide/colanic/teichoic acid biosynthesis glycosyltransferase